MKNIFISFFWGTLSFILLSSFQQPDMVSGKVIGIQDGDSITLLTDHNIQLKVRLEGIDCSEKRQDFGNLAKQFTSDLVFSQNVALQKTGQDRYGRTLGYVFLQDGTNLNEELLKAGLAWHFVKKQQIITPGPIRVRCEIKQGRPVAVIYSDSTMGFQKKLKLI